MKQFKLFFLSIGIVFFIVAFPFFLIISPVNHKHISLEKEEKMLRKIEKKSEMIAKAKVKNSANIAFFQEKLQEEAILPFLEEALNACQLSIVSIKPGQGSEHNEVHLVLRGEYRALLMFFSLLSQQPNSIAFVDVSIEKNHMEVILKDNRGNDEKTAAVKIKHHLNLEKRLVSALAPIEVSMFAFELINKHGPFQSLENIVWHLSGEIRKKGVLLGVFLEAQNHAQSYYFGLGFPWENSDWHIIRITQDKIAFENSKEHTRWNLFYHSAV